MLTQEYLKSVLHYSPQTGLFTNLMARRNRAKKGAVAGGLHPKGYITICLNYKSYLAHRLAWLYVYGELPERIDHINGNPADNRITNLRECTNSQNLHNRGNPANNRTGYKGVYRYKDTSRFVAQIWLDGQAIYLGVWDTAEEAHHAYKNASMVLSGNFSVYNRPIGE
jgi:hypothetical protein